VHVFSARLCFHKHGSVHGARVERWFSSLGLFKGQAHNRDLKLLRHEPSESNREIKFKFWLSAGLTFVRGNTAPNGAMLARTSLSYQDCCPSNRFLQRLFTRTGTAVAERNFTLKRTRRWVFPSVKYCRSCSNPEYI
jgi:hypothetical protein